MKNAEIFDYLRVAVEALQGGRMQFAANADLRRKHEQDGQMVLLAIDSVREMVTDRSYPQNCFLCDQVIASESAEEWHGLGNCVDLCTRCGGSGEEPKEKI